MAYGRCYAGGWPESYTDGMSPAQLATMQAPFANRLDRQIPQLDGTVSVMSRSQKKKEHDERVFGTKYF